MCGKFHAPLFKVAEIAMTVCQFKSKFYAHCFIYIVKLFNAIPFYYMWINLNIIFTQSVYWQWLIKELSWVTPSILKTLLLERSCSHTRNLWNKPISFNLWMLSKIMDLSVAAFIDLSNRKHPNACFHFDQSPFDMANWAGIS